MRSGLTVVTVVLCTGLLAACGDSGSDSSSTTSATATVPSGKLGAQGAEHCSPPQADGVVFTAFSARNMSCGEALAGALSVYRTHRYGDWNCTIRPSGTRFSADCANPRNTSVSFSADWQTS